MVFFFNMKNWKLPMTYCCQNSNLVLSIFKNILKYCFNVKKCQLNHFFRNKNKLKIDMTRCCQSSNIFFLCFLVLFLRSLVALAIYQSARVASPSSFDGHMSLDCSHMSSIYPSAKWHMLFARSLLCMGHEG